MDIFAKESEAEVIVEMTPEEAQIDDLEMEVETLNNEQDVIKAEHQEEMTNETTMSVIEDAEELEGLIQDVVSQETPSEVSLEKLERKVGQIGRRYRLPVDDFARQLAKENFVGDNVVLSKSTALESGESLMTRMRTGAANGIKAVIEFLVQLGKKIKAYLLSLFGQTKQKADEVKEVLEKEPEIVKQRQYDKVPITIKTLPAVDQDVGTCEGVVSMYENFNKLNEVTNKFITNMVDAARQQEAEPTVNIIEFKRFLDGEITNYNRSIANIKGPLSADIFTFKLTFAPNLAIIMNADQATPATSVEFPNFDSFNKMIKTMETFKTMPVDGLTRSTDHLARYADRSKIIARQKSGKVTPDEEMISICITSIAHFSRKLMTMTREASNAAHGVVTVIHREVKNRGSADADQYNNFNAGGNGKVKRRKRS